MADRVKITPRQARILAAIVRDYTTNPEPVGSEALEERYNFGFSSATIRNEMKALEQAGYITQPHTSAGRIPTDQGYRYFITQLMKHVELTGKEQLRLRSELRRLQSMTAELSRTVTRLLAESSESAAFALLPESTASSGFCNVVSAGLDQENLSAVAKFLDNLDENSRALVASDIKDVQTYVGSESPIPLSKDVSMVVTKVKLDDGRDGVVGIVGSKRMKYAKNISLLEYVSKLLTGGMGAIILFNLNI